MSSLGKYLSELGRSKEGKPDQVKEALDVYIELWQKAIEKGVVNPEDDVDSALEKVDQAGGLYKAAEA